MDEYADKPAKNVEYHGEPGYSDGCQDAVYRLLQHHQIEYARILTDKDFIGKTGPNFKDRKHCLLLNKSDTQFIAVRSGFATGYTGGGPTALAFAFDILEEFGIEIEECGVDEKILLKIDECTLTNADVQAILNAPNVGPMSLFDMRYNHENHARSRQELFSKFERVMPFSEIDMRIMDLAINFENDPYAALREAFIRLEDIVRERTGLDRWSAELFSQAFLSKDKNRLTWDVSDNECRARGTLFKSTYEAHRNPMSHTNKTDRSLYWSEFMLVNHLYKLEARGKPLQDSDVDQATEPVKEDAEQH